MFITCVIGLKKNIGKHCSKLNSGRDFEELESCSERIKVHLESPEKKPDECFVPVLGVQLV